MSKYSPEQLKLMAEIVMADHAADGRKALILFIRISSLTGLNANIVRDRIRFLSHV